MNRIHYITYASTLTLKAMLNPKVLDEIMAKSLKNNAKNGITGVLCFGDGLFFQYIEGHKAQIDALYQQIVADRRHHKVQLLQSGDRADRDFADWSMQCLCFEQLRHITTPNPYLWGNQSLQFVRQIADDAQTSAVYSNYINAYLRDVWLTHRRFIQFQTILFCLMLLSLGWLWQNETRGLMLH